MFIIRCYRVINNIQFNYSVIIIGYSVIIIPIGLLL